MEQAKIDRIYERLQELSLDLPRDSASLGAEFLKDQISLCRNYLNEVSHYLHDLLVEESYLAMKLDAEEATYQIRSTELLATNPQVASRPSIADRQAVIDSLLRAEKQSIIRLQSQIRALAHVKTVIKARQRELDNTMSTLRLQRSLLKDQLRTGAFYGDESERSRGYGGLDPADELPSKDLEELLAASERELDEERKVATQPPPVPPPTDPADELDADALEAIIAEAVPSINVRPIVVPSPQPEGETDDAAMHRFLSEPEEDLESILAGI